MSIPVIGFLTVLWVLLWGEVSALTVVGGLLVSLAVVWVFPFPDVSVRLRFRPVAFVILVLRFLMDLVVASFQVAWLAVRPKAPPRSALIKVDLVSASELLQTMTAELISLVPGSLLIELDHEGRRLWLHVLNADTPDLVAAARRKAHHQERRVLAALGTSAELAEFDSIDRTEAVS